MMSATSPTWWSFFFLQAEDGRRDADVTGVQTCALPIYAAELLAGAGEHLVLVVVAVKQRVRHVAVAVRPAVDGDRRDVARACEPAGTEHAVELVMDPRLELRK